MVRDSHELRQSWVAEDGIVGEGDVCHIEVEDLGAIVLASLKRDSEAYLAQGNRGTIGDAGEWHRRCQPLVGDLQLLERLDRDHVEARTPSRSVLVTAMLLMVGV